MNFRNIITYLMATQLITLQSQDLSVKSNILKTPNEGTDVWNNNIGIKTRAKTHLMTSFKSKIATRAEEVLSSDWMTSKNDVSSLCFNHTKMILQGAIAEDRWALKMIDSMGKPPSGLLEFNLMWPGNFDECVNTEVAITGEFGIPTRPFSTQYCLAEFSLGNGLNKKPILKVVTGVCVSNSCSSKDVGLLANTLFKLIPNAIINGSDVPPTAICKSNGGLDLDSKAIFVITFCSLFLCVMILATVYDLYIVYYLNGDKDVLSSSQQLSSGYGSMGHTEATREVIIHLLDGKQTFTQSGLTTSVAGAPNVSNKEQKQSSTLCKVFLAFSVYTNVQKMLNTSRPPGTLTAVHGLRFISMLWIILGHSEYFAINTTENVATYLPRMLKRVSFQVVSNATVAVDTFFVVSGLLVAYLTLKQMEKRGRVREFKWGMYYFHRFWRLTPPYMFFLMLYVPLIKYWIKGPFAPEGGIEVNECSDSWWRNLLYINNLYEDVKSTCMGWSWYLANDMQFYILSPLMLIPLYYSPLWGAVSCLSFIATGAITTGALSRHYEANANFVFADPAGKRSFDHIYVKPWCRIAPYAVGIYTGYLLYKCDCKYKLNKFMALFGWAIATVVALLVVYGLYDPDGGSKLGVDMSAFYNATFRLAWGICICWVVFACATRNGGPANTVLSWKCIIPLSRLTYCAYLVHPVVMSVYYLNLRRMVYATDLEMAYLFLANACLSYAVAFVISIAFESPMMGLEKVFLGPNRQ